MTTPTARRRSHWRQSTSSDVVVPSAPALSPLEDRSGRQPSSWRRLSVVGVGLFVLYVALSFALSPHGYLITDVGGKTAALAGMVERGDWSTDLGYWAENSDPTGDVFPYAHTWMTENGWWVNTTSLPMVLGARPLWAAGGAPLVLVVPMLCAVGAALVAGRIQAYLDGSDGLVAALVVGTASPLVIYALEFWEHAPGLFLMGLGSLSVLKAADGLGVRHGVAAGLWFGLAATMRQEALVYGFGAGLVLTTLLLIGARRAGHNRLRHQASTLAPAAGMVGAALGTLVLSTIAEAWYYGGAVRAGRSAQTASAAAGFDGSADRLAAAFLTTMSPINGNGPLVYALGAILLAGSLWLALAAEQGKDIGPPAIALSIIGMLFALRFIRLGPDFIPGMVPATSLAVVGAVFGLRRNELRRTAGLALVPLPIVLLTQYVGGAGVQWGGRYLLLTGYLLTIVACVALASRHRRLLYGLVAVGLLVTAGGVWFASNRTRAVAGDMARVADFADGDVVVWFDPVIAREGGPAIIEQRWLTTWADARTPAVLEVLAQERIDRFVYVDRNGRERPVFEAFVAATGTGAEQLEFFDQRLTVFERVGS